MSNKPFNLNESVINSVRSVLISSQEQEINSLVEQATSLFFAHNKDASKTLPVFVKEYVIKKTMNPTLATICETVARDNEKNLTETVENKNPQMLNEAAGSTPRNAKEKKLAAMAPPKNKITHKDVLVGRGVVAKEEAEHIDETSSGLAGRYIRRASDDIASRGYDIGAAAYGAPVYRNDTTVRKIKNRRSGIERAVSKLYKRAPDAPKDPWDDPKFYRSEETDTPGNSYKHQCAIHVKHEQFGEGKTIYSQHAEPDQDGNIAWYDVMFEHGIEKHVSINEIQVLQSESHMMHKKKKMKEDVEQIDEISDDLKKRYLKGAEKYFRMRRREDPYGNISDKDINRTVGIQRATDTMKSPEPAPVKKKKMKEDVEQIDEISDKLKNDYLEKAGKSLKKSPPFSKEEDKRSTGIARAKGLIPTKEEVEQVDEMKMTAFPSWSEPDLQQDTIKDHQHAAEFHRVHAKQAKTNSEKVYHNKLMAHHNGQAYTMKMQGMNEMKADPETLRADRSTKTTTTPSGRRIVIKKPKTELKVEEAEYVDEAKRGRPRKNPLPAGQAPEENDKEHFIMQLRKSVSMRGKKDVEFDNGEKMKVPSHVASAVLDHYNSMKTAEQKDRLHKSVSKSPKHLMSHYEMYHGN